MTFIVYPAIDLRRGQVVRLRQGDPDAQTIYGDDPAAVARQWAAQGAAWLHVVNLDGAFMGRGQDQGRGQGQDQGQGQDRGQGQELDLNLDLNLNLNLRRLAEIRAATDLPIQFGGGMRSPADIALALDLGATRVVLGTVAVRQPEIVAQAIARFGAERIVVGLDAWDGWVAIHGWRETSALDVLTVARRMKGLGVQRVVYTDIARDGTLTGVNLAETAALARASGLGVIASGGVASLDDIRGCAARAADGIEGVIVGQALYTGAIVLSEAIAVQQMASG